MPSKTYRKPSTKIVDHRADVPYSTNNSSRIFTKFVGRLKAKPQAQSHMSLGDFTNDRPAKGFSIELDTGPEPSESVVAEIATVGTGKHYEHILQIANHGNKAVSAEVWQI